MAEPAEVIERRMDELRVAVRQAVMAGDRLKARALRAELRSAEQAWEAALAGLAEAAPAHTSHPVPRMSDGLVPLREQVHHALTVLTVPAAPKLVIEVHRALFAGEILGARLTSLRRDEERSFRAAPYARPFYICAALTADLLAPARGLLAVSTWPMDRRVIAPLSLRVHFLISAIRVAEYIERLAEPSPAATRLLWRFAVNIPGAGDGFDATEPQVVTRAARAELDVHEDADRRQREAAAARARGQLNDAEQLFGGRLRAVPRTGTDS
ncbi:MAG TPA: hypothetical protein VFM54_04065 [Micromonosporaceae bacterium]|nr:hypothetical protein [Micromonosporaceae bacterium]